MTIDEAIKVLRQHNVKGASVSRITGGQALEKDLLAQVLDSCEQLISEKAEYKRLLKAAVEGMRWLNENTQDSDGSCAIRTEHGCSGCPLDINGDLFCKWKHEDEALALIGEDTNVPASAYDTNVDHKSGSWISCEDRLPETPEEGLGVWYSDCCLVCDSHDWCGMAYYLTDNKKSWWEFADAQNKVKIDWTEVTHWMPLPDPPKDGERNE